MKRVPLTAVLQGATQNVIRGGIRMLFDEHREEILQFLRTAEEERGAALLHDICRRFPPAAAIVTSLMGGSAEDAINSVAAFDQKLAQELRANMSSFRKLQEAYTRGTQDK